MQSKFANIRLILEAKFDDDHLIKQEIDSKKKYFQKFVPQPIFVISGVIVIYNSINLLKQK